MPTEPAIRSATTEDYAAISRLLCELDAYHVRLLPEVFQPFDDPKWQHERIGQFIDQDDAQIFLAEIGKDIVGLATVQITDNAHAPMFRRVRRARMDNLVVERKFQRLGIGKTLLDHVAHWAQSRGVPCIDINVWNDNSAGMAFFAAQEFTPRCQQMELRID